MGGTRTTAKGPWRAGVGEAVGVGVGACWGGTGVTVEPARLDWVTVKKEKLLG